MTDITHVPVEVLKPGQLAGLQIQSVEETDLTFKILVYGESGVGKTVLAGSACMVPEMSPVLMLDIEGGTLSLRARYPQVDVIRIKTWADLVKVHDALKTTDHGYKTVIVDSLTEAQKIGMSTIMRRAVLKAEEDGNERDPDLPGIGEWGKNTNQMRALVRSFRDLPMNVIFNALSARDQDKKGNWLTRPSLSAKLASEIAGFMDVVLYMYMMEKDGEQLRLLLSQRTQEVIAKDRTDRLPAVVGGEGVPTVDMLHGMMFGELLLPRPTPQPPTSDTQSDKLMQAMMQDTEGNNDND